MRYLSLVVSYLNSVTYILLKSFSRVIFNFVTYFDGIFLSITVVCVLTEGMSDPLTISPQQLTSSVATASPEDARPGQPGWKAPVPAQGATSPSLIIDLTPSYVDEDILVRTFAINYKLTFFLIYLLIILSYTNYSEYHCYYYNYHYYYY